MLYKRIFCFIVIFLFAKTSFFAQGDLREDIDFFMVQIEEYKAWLEYAGLASVLRVDSLSINKSKLVMYLGSPYNDTYNKDNPDSLMVAWEKLKTNFQAKNQKRLEEELFNTFFFQMEVGRDSAEIVITGKNPYNFTVSVNYNYHSITVDERLAMAKNMRGIIVIAADKLQPKIRTMNDTLNDRVLANVRQEISDYLVNYYQQQGTPVLYTADVEILRNYEHELIFEVTNISHEILHDIGYFEYIRITVNVKQQGNDVAISYDLQGKYGSGIFRAPRKANYKSMDIKYADYLKDYEIRLVNKIRNIL